MGYVFTWDGSCFAIFLASFLLGPSIGIPEPLKVLGTNEPPNTPFVANAMAEEAKKLANVSLHASNLTEARKHFQMALDFILGTHKIEGGVSETKRLEVNRIQEKIDAIETLLKKGKTIPGTNRYPGYYSKALDLEEKAEAAENLFGSSDSRYYRIVHELADTHIAKGAPKQAAPLYMELVKGMKPQQKTDPGTYMTLLEKAGNASLASGKLKQAVRMYKNLLALLEGGSKPHPRAIHVHMQLSQAFSQDGALDDALEHAQKAVNQYEDGKIQNGNVGAEQYAFGKSHVAHLLEQLNRNDEAVNVAQQAYDMLVQHKGKNDPITLQGGDFLKGLKAHIAKKPMQKHTEL